MQYNMLWGEVQFLTDGIVRERVSVEWVQLPYRQYSLDGKSNHIRSTTRSGIDFT